LGLATKPRWNRGKCKGYAKCADAIPDLFKIRRKLFSGHNLEFEENPRTGPAPIDEMHGAPKLFGFTALGCGVLPKMRHFREGGG
jgi:hypothetical protein